jgi:hypothetical protein
VPSRSLVSRALLGTLAALALAFAGCGEASPPPRTPRAEGEVPANSESEHREANEQRRKRADEVAAMPTTPAGSGATATATRPGGPGRSGPKATRLECEKVLDRYLDLQLTTNPELAAVAKDLEQAGMRDALKAQARQQNGGKTPCEQDGISRAQYSCGMAASTLEAWRACME